MTSPAAEAKNLTLTVRSGLLERRTVLGDISFTLPEGAVMGLVGRNGAGKSSLLRCLVGLAVPQGGESTLLGSPSLDLSDTVRERLGYVAQTPDLFGRLSGNEHLREMAAVYRHFDDRRALLLALKLDLPMGIRADKLSLGDQQKLSVVLALAHRPDLLILDEPVASLDPLARRDFMRELFADANDKRSVLISSHLLSDLERVVSHVMFLREGRIQLVDSWDALMENLRVIACAEVPTHAGVVHGRRVGMGANFHALVDLRAEDAPTDWKRGLVLRMDDLFEELNG
jgi:ABC-2 type transport system ATP-binding protein